MSHREPEGKEERHFRRSRAHLLSPSLLWFSPRRVCLLKYHPRPLSFPRCLTHHSCPVLSHHPTRTNKQITFCDAHVHRKIEAHIQIVVISSLFLWLSAVFCTRDCCSYRDHLLFVGSNCRIVFLLALVEARHKRNLRDSYPFFFFQWASHLQRRFRFSALSLNGPRSGSQSGRFP
jgi:hypothetical protein